MLSILLRLLEKLLELLGYTAICFVHRHDPWLLGAYSLVLGGVVFHILRAQLSKAQGQETQEE